MKPEVRHEVISFIEMLIKDTALGQIDEERAINILSLLKPKRGRPVGWRKNKQEVEVNNA